MTVSKKTIVLGSRGSMLALWQTNYVKALLEVAVPDYEYRIEVVHTKGDKILDVALSKFGDKGLFTKELERGLLDGSLDLCVHSMKDMPTMLPEGLGILGVPERACPNDVLVSLEKGMTLDALPAGSRVATGSLRRVAQLHRLRPDVEACEIRGNVDSRISRVESGEFDAAILAAAGIERLGFGEHIASLIPVEAMVPAVGQGAIAIEGRSGDAVASMLCSAVSDMQTMRAVAAERIVLRALEGGCQVPMGVYAFEAGTGVDAVFSMDAFVSSLDGAKFLHAHAEGAPFESGALAQNVSDDLRAQGADVILEELR